MMWFRAARPAPFAWNYAKTLAQTVVFWGLFFVLVPMTVSWVERRLGVARFEPQRTLAAAVFVVFGAIGLWSAYTMVRVGQGTPLPLDTARRLVVAGLYRHVRNPMAVAGLVQGLATGLWFGSFSVLAYVIAGAVFWNLVIRPVEEADLQRRFGADYDDYRRSVRCWWPRATPYRPGL